MGYILLPLKYLGVLERRCSFSPRLFFFFSFASSFHFTSPQPPSLPKLEQDGPGDRVNELSEDLDKRKLRTMKAKLEDFSRWAMEIEAVRSMFSSAAETASVNLSARRRHMPYSASIIPAFIALPCVLETQFSLLPHEILKTSDKHNARDHRLATNLWACASRTVYSQGWTSHQQCIWLS